MDPLILIVSAAAAIVAAVPWLALRALGRSRARRGLDRDRGVR
jgi:hypothetical protein